MRCMDRVFRTIKLKLRVSTEVLNDAEVVQTWLNGIGALITGTLMHVHQD